MMDLESLDREGADGGGPGEADAFLGGNPTHHHHDEEKSGEDIRPKNRRGPSIWISILCCISILAIAAFFMVKWSESQSPGTVQILAPGEDGEGDHQPAAGSGEDSQNGGGSGTGTSDGSKPSNGDSSTPPSIIPPSEYFDLKRTGFVVSASSPQVREFVFNITRGPGDPDGVSKSMILINGQSPGPLIEANIGDTIRVVVHNSMLEDSTSVHWHGIDQRDSVFMDGVPGVTQCGIPPGESFTYQFGVPNQRGSFWYHGHVSVQYTDGLFGPLIVHDPDEKVPAVDDDKIIMIGDIHHMDGRQAAAEYLSASPSWSPMGSGSEPYPDNLIINGRHVSSCSQPDVTAAQTCASGSRYTTRVKSGSRTRLRLISHSSNTPYWFSVDNHVLSIVEMDGVEIEPVATTRVFMNPGQRYSVILTADQAVAGRPARNFLMRAVATCAMLDHKSDSAFSNVGSQATGVLSYDDADPMAPHAGQPWPLDATDLYGKAGAKEPWGNRCHDLPFGLGRPVRQENAFEVGERNRHYVYFRFDQEKDGITRTYINDTTYAPPGDIASIWTIPPQDMSSTSAVSKIQVQTHIFVSRDEDKAAEVAISAGNMMGHPWHLHGQTFQVVGWGRGVFGTEGATTHWNLKNPVRRDTVTVAGHSHVVIRFKAENPGVWALHCHIQWHAEGGMFVQTAQRLGRLRELIDGLGGVSEKDGGDIRGRFCTTATASSAASGTTPASTGIRLRG